MTSSVRSANPRPQPSSSLSLEETDKRKKRLLAVVSQGLPTLPNYVLDLNALLTSASVDLKKVGSVIRTDPSLSAQVLRLCNSALFGLRRRVLSIEQAAVLLGTERLRTLVLTCSLMQFAGKKLTGTQLMSFWQHSFLCALLSERVARQVDYFEKEQAYLGGLLHDIGQLPLWTVAIEEENKHRPLPPQRQVGERENVKPFIVIAYDAERRPLLLLPLALGHRHGVRTACFMGGKHSTFNMALGHGIFAADATAADLNALV